MVLHAGMQQELEISMVIIPQLSCYCKDERMWRQGRGSERIKFGGHSMLKKRDNSLELAKPCGPDN